MRNGPTGPSQRNDQTLSDEQVKSVAFGHADEQGV